MRCDECKYWDAPKPDEWDLVFSIMGTCRQTPHASDMTVWIDGDERIIDQYDDRTAAAWDGSEHYEAGLVTKAGHFCAMFSPRKGHPMTDLEKDRAAETRERGVVDRLRIVTGFIRFETGSRVTAAMSVSEEAACLIETLSARVAELEAAIRPFADCIFNDNGDVTVNAGGITSEHLKQAYFVARAALSTKPEWGE